MDNIDLVIAVITAFVLFIVVVYVGIGYERSLVCSAVGGEYVDRTCYQDLKPMDIWVTEK